MDFDSSTSKISICGRTKNSVNSIQLRYNDNNGVQNTELLEFPYSEEYIEKDFDISELTGEKDISFVFLPGSNFDFKWFKFE